uniref:Uncharacterized protein n=1 Tax=Ciona savignyi TaxID=51511 RepID=H2YX89_CIOSA
MPSPASPPFRHARRGRPSSPRWQFLEELVKDLEMETTNKIAQKQEATSSTQQGPASRLMGRHFVSWLSVDHQKKSCVVCNQKSIHQRDTTQ